VFLIAPAGGLLAPPICCRGPSKIISDTRQRGVADALFTRTPLLSDSGPRSANAAAGVAEVPLRNNDRLASVRLATAGAAAGVS